MRVEANLLKEILSVVKCDRDLEKRDGVHLSVVAGENSLHGWVAALHHLRIFGDEII